MAFGQNPISYNLLTFNGAVTGGQSGVQKDAWGSQRHGSLYSAAYGVPKLGTVPAVAGAVFSASNASTTTLSVGLATTYTGICLSNPAASTVNLVVRKVGIGVSATTAANAFGLATGWSSAGVVTHTTPITGILANYIGAATSSGSVGLAAASQAKVDAACTIVGTPLYTLFFGGVATSSVFGGLFSIDDGIIVPPGGYCCVVGTGGTTGFWGTFNWEELAP
jgi:hypothetical protein